MPNKPASEQNKALTYCQLQFTAEVNIGQILNGATGILVFSTRHGIDGSRSFRRASSRETDNIEGPHNNRRASESENGMEKQ